MSFTRDWHNRGRTRLAVIGAIILSTLAVSTVVSAASPSQTRAEPEANLPFLFAVFIITWAAFFAYVFYVSRRQREMQGEIEALKQALDERDRQTAEQEEETNT